MKAKEIEKTNKFSNPMGISLIVLVITIIVIIILATAIIISVIDSNPLSEANKARFQSDRDNMQSIFTNTVAKVMAVNQGSIKVKPGTLNEVTSGVKNTIGVANYEIENGSDSSKANGTITFDNKSNTDTEYYTGKQLPIYKAGETKWYVDSEGLLLLEVGKQVYGEGKKEVEGSEGEKIEVDKDEYNALRLRVTQLEEENGKLKSELEKTKSELEIANNRIKELEIGVGEIAGEAKKFTDKNGKVAVIPVGFAIVPGKNVVKDGLVISDVANDTGNVGNQFVWIPVDNISTFKRVVGYFNGGAIQTSANGTIDFAKCEEPYSSASQSERKEYESMINSVKEYKGFYIGRYEISKSEDGSERPQSKKNKAPWVNIAWGASMTDTYGGIVAVARSMYQSRNDNKKGEVVSTLMYGTAWDEVIRFLKTNEKYKDIDRNSHGFGNLGASAYDESNASKLTGSSDTYCLNNIYDIVGNVWEWTMEVYKGQSGNASLGRIIRGGGYDCHGYTAPVSVRHGNTSIAGAVKNTGGRIQLYIK